jgi:plastocyanin
MTTRDVLVFLVIVLLALVLIEGIILYNASPVGQTVTQTVTQNNLGTVTLSTDSVTTDTLTSTSTSTSTVTASSVSTETSTTTATSTSTFTTSLTTTTTASGTGSTTKTTTTTTTITNSGPFVVILPGSGANKSSKGFYPSSITIVLGVNNTVTWINEDTVPHTVSSLSSTEPFNSGNLAPGQTYSFTFTIAGTYSYTDIDHPWETGTVTVKA